MKRAAKVVLGSGIVVGILLALFLLPVIPISVHYACFGPASGCPALSNFASVAYAAFNVGAVYVWSNHAGPTYCWMEGNPVYKVCGPFQEISSQAAIVNDSKKSLLLRLYLTASSNLTSGPAVSVFVDEYNPLYSTVNVSAADEWVVALNGNDGAPCWIDGSTVGFAIAQGYYTSSNVTAAKFLDLVNPGATYSCPLYLGYGNPRGLLFQGMSDIAASYGCIGMSSCLTGSASTEVTPSSWGPATGYWNQGGAFTSFPRGAYSVVAEDQWGELVILHLTVE